MILQIKLLHTDEKGGGGNNNNKLAEVAELIDDKSPYSGE